MHWWYGLLLLHYRIGIVIDNGRQLPLQLSSSYHPNHHSLPNPFPIIHPHHHHPTPIIHHPLLASSCRDWLLLLTDELQLSWLIAVHKQQAHYWMYIRERTVRNISMVSLRVELNNTTIGIKHKTINQPLCDVSISVHLREDNKKHKYGKFENWIKQYKNRNHT